ncbi:protein-L-isoaspartate(D-aspartate) O-methyltransferase [Candidatus Aminicenantes bacterium AC-334-K16]|jgi:protein-L-isoaspartate(D-aspartate) O-methyltransferase|nr:protein-L-isoaspartate(D-aspartate) O-methyltransferase [Candidatus Aminicenantes bacterium AC-334-K16]
MKKKDWATLRKLMVDNQLRARGIKDERVLQAMEKVPRHLFVPENMQEVAYSDEPLPIGEGQTISQPYIVAYMTEAIQPESWKRVLEIGTGSGYQAAILAELVKEVYTVELIPELAERAKTLLDGLGYQNIHYKIGDGTLGWPEEAPFDSILVTAAPAKIPTSLEEQLGPGGRLIIPVGEMFQDLYLVIREKDKLSRQKLLSVRFVPLVTLH